MQATRCGRYALAASLEFTVVVRINSPAARHLAGLSRRQNRALQPWAFIILMIPVIGALAYVVVELVPEWLSGATVQQARRRVANKRPGFRGQGGELLVQMKRAPAYLRKVQAEWLSIAERALSA